MKASKFPTNLFDFDFAAEAASKAAKAAKISEYYKEVNEERAAVLRKMRRRALDEDRIDAYFRLSDSLENYASEPLPTPSAYGIPEVRLSYINDCTDKPQVTCPDITSSILRSTFAEGEIGFQEFFKVLYLNRANKVLGVHTVSKGGITATVVDLKILFTGALLAHAAAIIVCHNHPSGNLCPSPEDERLTKKIREAGKLLEIPLLDHIILTEDGYYSFADNWKL